MFWPGRFSGQADGGYPGGYPGGPAPERHWHSVAARAWEDGAARGALADLGVQLSFTTAAVVLAGLFVATHFYVRQAAVGFGRVNRGGEGAAMVDGASRMGVFSHRTSGVPGTAGGSHDRLGTGSGRVRGHHHLRGELPVCYADHTAGDLRRPGERLRRGGGARRAGPGLLVRRYPGRPVLRQEGGRARGLSYAFVRQDHDVRGFDKGSYLFAGLEAELVGALAGDEGDDMVVPDLKGYLGCRFPLYHLDYGAG